MAEQAKLWIAKFEFPSGEAEAFGHSPEEAVSGLVDAWRQHADISGAAPEYLADCRDEVHVRRVSLGAGYVKGVTDGLWFDDAGPDGEPASLSGADSRFDGAFGEKSPKPS